MMIQSRVMRSDLKAGACLRYEGVEIIMSIARGSVEVGNLFCTEPETSGFWLSKLSPQELMRMRPSSFERAMAESYISGKVHLPASGSRK